jgi:hypothetical protein
MLRPFTKALNRRRFKNDRRTVQWTYRGCCDRNKYDNQQNNRRAAIESRLDDVTAGGGTFLRILDPAPGSFLIVLCIKAEDAGRQVILLYPRTLVGRMPLLRNGSQTAA